MRTKLPSPGIQMYFAVALSVALLGCGAQQEVEEITSEEAEGEVKGVPVAETERPQDEPREESLFQEAFRYHKHATVYTDFDVYDVRNISFHTGHGFGSGDALIGYYLNTRLDLDIRFIDQIRILGRITMTEALSVPHRYDMIEEQDLDYIFRTELKKVSGERIEYIVRINRIAGQLQEGGPFRLDSDELQTLRKIVFY